MNLILVCLELKNNMTRMFGPVYIDEAEDLVEKMLDDIHFRDTVVRYLTHAITKDQFGYEVDIIAENNTYVHKKSGEPWL